MGNNSTKVFNPIGFLKILSPRQLRKWGEEAHKRDALVEQRLLAKRNKHKRGKFNEKEKAKRMSNEEIESIRNQSLNPNRKSLCHGARVLKVPPLKPFQKPRGYISDPRKRIKVDRSKIRKPGEEKD